MPEQARPLFKADGIVTGYGAKQVLNGVSIEVVPKEIVAMIGHNGAGKSTLLKAVFGLLPLWHGQVIVDNARLSSPKPRELLGMGMAYVPQGNRIFTDLTVRENLEMGGFTLSDSAHMKEGIERVLALFPILKQRLRQRAGTLSGGEKQMLALGNAIILSPRLLLLDEPSLGLAPQLVTQAFRHIQEISRDFGVAVLIVEQKVREVLKIAQRVYVLRNGLVSFSGTAQSLTDENKLRQVYL